MKICSRCRLDRVSGDFQVRKSGRLDSWCRPCRREYNANYGRSLAGKASQIKYRFGLSMAEYDALAEAQGGVCAVCEKECSFGRALAVDHDHQAGRVRGLLCARCNVTLGNVSDDPGLLHRLAAYLEDPYCLKYEALVKEGTP